ncbi:MAG TPA: hypothetical protein VN222_16835 [Novosphingobium sp.]|nr:hypothetical protein [Novosphingobium sp.]
MLRSRPSEGLPAAYMFAADTKLIDADGAPNAYHPDDSGHGAQCPDNGYGLDCLASAGFPGSDWWHTVLVRDPASGGKPYVQSSGPWAGYYVSMTSLRNTAYAGVQSPLSYVNAAQVPYVVLPAPIYRTRGMGGMGDIGFAINLSNGRTTPFVIADEGPVEPLGEASVAFWQALGGDAPNPRNGAGLPAGRIAYIVFPKSRRDADIGWPIDAGRLRAEAQRLLGAYGGEAALSACFARPAPGVDLARADEPAPGARVRP